MGNRHSAINKKGENMTNDYKYCLVAKDKEGIVLWVGYNELPTEADIEQVKNDTKNDPEWAYQGNFEDLVWAVADEVEFEQFQVMTQNLENEEE
jgi:hypothetical protein